MSGVAAYPAPLAEWYAMSASPTVRRSDPEPVGEFQHIYRAPRKRCRGLPPSASHEEAMRLQCRVIVAEGQVVDCARWREIHKANPVLILKTQSPSPPPRSESHVTLRRRSGRGVVRSPSITHSRAGKAQKARGGKRAPTARRNLTRSAVAQAGRPLK